MNRVKRAVKNVTRGQNGKPKVPQENDEKSKGANAPQDQRTLKEEKGGGGTQPGGRSSKVNEERKTTNGQPDKPNSGIQPSDNTEPGANAPQDQRTLKEEKGGGGTQPGGRSSKENEERKTTDGQPDKPDSGIQPSDSTEPGANAPQDQRTLKEEKGGGGTQPGGRSSKENEERKTTDGQPDEPDSGIQPSDSTEPAAKGSHDQRTLEEEKRSKVTQPGVSSKENQGRKTNDGERDQLHSGTQTRDNREPGRKEEAEENSDESEDRSSRLSMSVLDIPDSVYRTVCIKLNADDPIFFKDYRLLCETFEDGSSLARLLEQAKAANPTDELLWDWSKKNGDEATVEKLIKLLKEEDLNRMDVVKILEEWVQTGPHSRLSTQAIPLHIKSRICLMLNIEDKSRRDYRRLAEKLGYNRFEIDGLKQGKADPTDTLIKMRLKESGPLTVSELIQLLKNKREDVVAILEDWLGGKEAGAKGSQGQRTLKEENRGRGTQPEGSSKENQGRKTTGGADQFVSGTQTRVNTEPDLDPSFPFKSGTPSRDDILGIANELGKRWKMLGRVLQVPDPVLEEINEDNRDLSERCYQVLRRWELMFASDATYQRLAQALQHHMVGLRKVAEKYCGLHS